ncbi:MAG: AAA family ATPase [Anaerolineae bacterium]|uniref:AAA family ATPase n=1 Tax=Candidatus Amarolinea dominans TaxID=3140696 RepID=UPI003136B9EB|nr:AAA family ATPase [Anaerolineae bacterium]
MKFPYGISDFLQVMSEGYFYVDRTDCIPLLEDLGKQLLFLRPRCFGKSLLLSMLANYYDVARADQFELLFGRLAIGRAPTPLHNQYFVMRWDFSLVAAQGAAEDITQALYRHVNARIHDFAVRYQDRLSSPVEIFPTDAVASFESALTAMRHTPYKLYLLIDEYDNFANELAMGGHPAGKKRYDALLRGEGTLKTLFKAVKGGASGFGVDRVFITGVSPVVLSDLTSGYNVSETITLQPEFNDLCGFREDEIAVTLRQITATCGWAAAQADEALEMVRTFYNGYRFTTNMAAERIYNPTLALYFFKHFQRACGYPENMLDSNLAMDRGKIAYIASLPGGGQLILDAVNGAPTLAVSALADRFGVEDMLMAVKDAPFMASFLTYFGVLTFGGRTPSGELMLTIPNLVVRRLYVERIQDMLLADRHLLDEGRQAARGLWQTGNLQPLCNFIEQRYYPVFDNRDYRWANELTVKTAFLTLLFNDIAYIMDSETALARTYADLTMIVRPEMRQYELLDILLEFKYVPLKEAELTGAAARALSAAAVAELPLVKARLAEALAILPQTRAGLLARYGERLRLRTFAVVSLGFDRLVWQELNVERSLEGEE